MRSHQTNFNQLSFLLYFIFGGAIVGETVALTMVVTTLGPEMLSNLYLINGLLLLLLPIFFFKKIDTVNRGSLLSNQLLVSAAILFCYLLIFGMAGKIGYGTPVIVVLIFFIYPISYLSKTILFLTFWTLANDVYATNEAKKGFPIVAAWGFVGGLSGACSARLLLEKVDIEMIMGLWICAYLVGLFFSKNITKKFKYTLSCKENCLKETEKPHIFLTIENILDTRLIRIISFLYFCVFIAVFLQDYLFWKKSYNVFTTAKTLASFQFTYYLTHSLVTIVGLRFFMPRIIYKLGFMRIFEALPIVLLSGSVIMLVLKTTKCDFRIFFTAFLIIQAMRYIVFENAFSPIYQMFFAAIPKEKRGRAKTFLEGVIKPSAIILSGIILTFFSKYQTTIIIVIGLLSVVMVYCIFRLKKIYIEALIPQYPHIDASEDIISKIGSYKDLKIVSLIREYSSSVDADVRSLAVKILSYDGSKHAFKIIKEIFEHEQNQIVKEIVARSLKYFTFSESKIFVEQLLSEPNPRIRANTVYSVNGMNCLWKDQLYPIIHSMFFENNPRIQIEAARFLWNHGIIEDKKKVLTLIDGLYTSKNPNKRSAALYLMGLLKPEKWEHVLLESLQQSPFQVFKKSIEIIFNTASKQTQLRTLTIVEGMSRKNISSTGKILQSIREPAIDTILEYMRVGGNQRLIVEVIHVLRLSVHRRAGNSKDSFAIDDAVKEGISQWAIKDLKNVYFDCFLWNQYRRQDTSKNAVGAARILEEALRDQLQRLCERIVDVVALLENKEAAAIMRHDFDMHDLVQRQSLAEILENCGKSAVTQLIVPILRNDDWEDLARIGHGRFNFSMQGSREPLACLIRSNNHWICFCSLYVWYKRYGPRSFGNEDRVTLSTIQNGHSAYLSKAVRDLLALMHEQHDTSIESFELLERVLSLKKTLLFRHIQAEKLMGLAELIESRSYKSGTLISREGEISDHLYIVRSGSLRIIKVKNNIKTQLSILGPGETYGEIGLFNQAPRSASALAHGDCELWVVQRSALKRYLLDMPEIAYNFLEIFSEKLRKSSEEVAQLAISNKKEYL